MIPVVPLPAFLCPRWDPVPWTPAVGPDLRASHADRDVAADILCAAVADGRLTLDELDERLEHVLSARTLREIARLVSDLPGRRFPGPGEAVGGRTASRRPTRQAAPSPGDWPRPAAESRWSLLQSLVAPAGCP
jgi:Domain of unknown function (DUF1707)